VDCTYWPKPDPQDCHIAECNPLTGACEAKTGNDGGACTDPADMCTVGKTCSTGVCVGGTAKDCSSYTYGCYNGACNTLTGDCYSDPVAPGQACFDPQVINECNDGQCDSYGTCQPVPANPGAVCEDGDPCTSGETCDTQGGCVGGVSVTQVIEFEDDFSDNSAGWIFDVNDPNQEWQIGPATVSTGHSYGNPDPGTDHTSATTDNGVAGVVIGGNADTFSMHPYYYLTSPVVDTSAVAGTMWLGFHRWLNSDYSPFMQNIVQVFDGTSWVTLWESGSSPGVTDAAWTLVTYDLTSHKNANMQIRFGFVIGSTGVFTVSSWNIDDVTIANVVCNPP